MYFSERSDNYSAFKKTFVTVLALEVKEPDEGTEVLLEIAKVPVPAVLVTETPVLIPEIAVDTAYCVEPPVAPLIF